MRTYTVVLEFDAEAGAYGVYVPALPGCYSQGTSVEEVLANVAEAIRGHITALEQIGVPVPVEGAAAASEALAAVAPARGTERVLLTRVAA